MYVRPLLVILGLLAIASPSSALVTITNVTCDRSGGNHGLLNGWGVCSGD